MTAAVFSVGGFDPGRVGRLDAWLEREVDAGRLPGAALLIWRQGRIVRRRALGHADHAGLQAVTLDTIFWIASMTKPITSLAALLLAEDGRLVLSEPVATYLPAFVGVRVLVDPLTRATVAPRRPPTVQDLLRHTAGLTYGQFVGGPIGEAYRLAGLYDFGGTNARLAERAAEVPLCFHPGERFEYGLSTDLLGAVIEAVSQQSLGAFITERITGPLAMADTGFAVSAAVRYRCASRPDLPADPPLVPPLDPEPAWESGGSGLWSSAEDYLRFARMLLGGGALDGVRVAAPSTIRLMMANHLPPGVAFGAYTPQLGITAPTPEMGQGFGYGLAVRLEDGRNPVPGSVGDAYWPGVSGCNFWIDPARDLAVVFMAHAPQWRNRHRAALRQLVYQALED